MLLAGDPAGIAGRPTGPGVRPLEESVPGRGAVPTMLRRAQDGR
jgi:hypothetical protein